MAAVTAAVIGATATLAATGAGIAQSQGAFGGGGGGGGSASAKPMAEDPQDKAMKDYYARMVVANTDKTYPSFGTFLQSGADPAKADFGLITPGLKPSEAAALGFTGGRGEQIPYMTQNEASDIATTGQGGKLTPQQTMYLAQERRRAAAMQGGDPNKQTWATRAVSTANTLDRVNQRLSDLQAIEDPTKRQTRRIDKLTGRQSTLSGRQQDIFGGDPTG